VQESTAGLSVSRRQFRIEFEKIVRNESPHLFAGEHQQLVEQLANLPLDQASGGRGPAAAARVVLRFCGLRLVRMDPAGFARGEAGLGRNLQCKEGRKRWVRMKSRGTRA
jgi:hypothetical protein